MIIIHASGTDAPLSGTRRRAGRWFQQLPGLVQTIDSCAEPVYVKLNHILLLIASLVLSVLLGNKAEDAAFISLRLPRFY